MSIHRSPPVAQAHDRAVSERRRIEAEIVAFERFVDHVRDLSVDERIADGGTHLLSTPRTVTDTSEAAPFREVRRAYRQTVLAVEHWQEAYEESTVAESMAGEFSTDLASLVTRPGTTRFSSPLRTHIIEEGERVVAVRQRALALIEAEIAELERLAAEFETVIELLASVRTGQTPFETRVESVRQARQKLEWLRETHQAYIHGCPRRRYDPLVSSLYADLDVSYPGLSAITDYLGQVQRVDLRLWAGLYTDRCAPAESGQ